MANSYTVTIYERVSYSVDVEADNEDEAYDEALEEIQSEGFDARQELEFEGYETYEVVCTYEDDEEEEEEGDEV